MATPLVQFSMDVQRFSGRLARFIAATGRDADQAVYAVATDVLSDTQIGWPVDTGVSRAAWWGPRRIGPAAVQIGNPFRYASVIEFGGYPGVGPKTQKFGPSRLPGGFIINAGIFPRQKPAAPLRRALAKHWGEMTKHIRAAHGQQWGR